MDFQSLTSKELQALCKNNKILANITNVSMADALTALDNVEGLEEILKQSQLSEKAIPESPSIPYTATRTATRIKEELETAQPTMHTRWTKRKEIDQDLDLENKNVNLVQTPTAPANRRRASATLARSVQQEVYSMRRSARLLEKTMGELSLKDRVIVERVKMKVFDETEERDVSCMRSVQQGVYSTRRSARLLEKTMGELSLKDRVMVELVKMKVFDESKERDMSGNLEKTNDFSSVESLIEAPKCERELKDDVQEKDNCADDNETSEESDEMGTVDVPVTELTSETENPSTDVYDEIPAKDNKANESENVQLSFSVRAKQIRSALKRIELCLLNGGANERSIARNMDGHDSEDSKQSIADKTVFVLNHLQQVQNRFQIMFNSVVLKIDEMGGRINELEQIINDLRDKLARLTIFGSFE